MNSVLQSCGWKVSPIANRQPGMTSKQFDNMFNPILYSEFNPFSCFMFFYTGHGNSKGLLLSDGCCRPYVDIVRNVSKIPSLVGKPKIFIFDSCRTEKEKSHHCNFFKEITKAHALSLYTTNSLILFNRNWLSYRAPEESA